MTVYGTIIIIRVHDGKVRDVSCNLSQHAVFVLNEDTGEYEYPMHDTRSADELNDELNTFPDVPSKPVVFI